MKIGILSDIHGNAEALTSVLDAAKDSAIERLFILGDIVGYYYEPDIIMHMLKEWQYDFVRGNHEEMLLKAQNDKGYLDNIDKKYGTGIRIALNKLTASDIEFLTASPITKLVACDEMKIQLCHGAPWDVDEYIYPDSASELFERCAAVAADFILLGNTHYPFISCWQGKGIVNPGSVGQARDQSGMASWAILDTCNRTVVFRKTPYDCNKLLEQAKNIDPLVKYNQDVLVR